MRVSSHPTLTVPFGLGTEWRSIQELQTTEATTTMRISTAYDSKTGKLTVDTDNSDGILLESINGRTSPPEFPTLHGIPQQERSCQFRVDLRYIILYGTTDHAMSTSWSATPQGQGCPATAPGNSQWDEHSKRSQPTSYGLVSSSRAPCGFGPTAMRRSSQITPHDVFHPENTVPSIFGNNPMLPPVQRMTTTSENRQAAPHIRATGGTDNDLHGAVLNGRLGSKRSSEGYEGGIEQTIPSKRRVPHQRGAGRYHDAVITSGLKPEHEGTRVTANEQPQGALPDHSLNSRETAQKL